MARPLAVGAEGDGKNSVLALGKIADWPGNSFLNRPEPHQAVLARVAAGGRQPLAVAAVHDRIGSLGEPGKAVVKYSVRSFPERDFMITRSCDLLAVRIERQRRDGHRRRIGCRDGDGPGFPQQERPVFGRAGAIVSGTFGDPPLQELDLFGR